MQAAADSRLELQELLEEVRRIEVLSRRLVTEMMAGGYNSVFKGSGIEFDGVREYVDGDDPRLVDWNVTARVGRPFVKKYVDERELTVVFALDLSASMEGGFGHWSMRQTAARVCGCLALSAIRNNDKVGLIAFSDDVHKYVPPKKGVGHALRIVRDSLALRGGPSTAFAPALEFAARVIRKRAVLFLISDFLGDDWRQPIRLCGRRHDLIAVRLRPPERRAPSSGMMRVRDPESGRLDVVDWSHPRVRQDYEARTVAHDAMVADELHRAGVDLLDVPLTFERDPDMIARPILRFFRMRQRRGAKR